MSVDRLNGYNFHVEVIDSIFPSYSCEKDNGL
jgi:hypothetical protein